MTSLEELKEALPDYARDIKLNLSTLAGEEGLAPEPLWGCFLACALASRNPEVTAAITAEAQARLSPEAMNAARAAAAVMAMNNVYYRFTHLAGNAEYRTMPARLRMNVIANPGVDKLTFELWCLAVSAINGCGACIDSHESLLVKNGMTPENIQTAIRIAATVHAAACVLDGERNAVGQGLASAA